VPVLAMPAVLQAQGRTDAAAMAQAGSATAPVLEGRSRTRSYGVLWANRHAFVTIDVSRAATVQGQSLGGGPTAEG